MTCTYRCNLYKCFKSWIINFYLVYSYGYGSVEVMAAEGAGRDKYDIIILWHVGGKVKENCTHKRTLCIYMQ